MKRFECLQAIAPLITDELFVTTAGGATNEWNAIRPSDGNIQVKTLGLCSSIGLGLAIGLPNRKVFVFDGDGALWMNLGSLATIGRKFAVVEIGRLRLTGFNACIFWSVAHI